MSLKDKKQEVLNKIKALYVELDRLKCLSSDQNISDYCENMAQIDTKTISEVFDLSQIKASKVLKKIGYKCKIAKIAGKSAKIYVRAPN